MKFFNNATFKSSVSDDLKLHRYHLTEGQNQFFLWATNGQHFLKMKLTFNILLQLNAIVLYLLYLNFAKIILFLIFSHFLHFCFFFISMYISSSVLKSILSVSNKTIKFYLYFWLFSSFSFFFQLFSVFIHYKYLIRLRFLLTWSPFVFCEIAQLIFDSILLKFYRKITNNIPFLGYFLLYTAIFVVVVAIILCFLFDSFILSFNSAKENFMKVMETFAHITSIYCFVKTFFLSKDISSYLNRKTYNILKLLTIFYESIFLGYVFFNILFSDTNFYLYVNILKPKLFKFMENLSVFSYFYICIFQITISSISVIILNFDDSENSNENDDQYSLDNELKMSLTEY